MKLYHKHYSYTSWDKNEKLQQIRVRRKQALDAGQATYRQESQYSLDLLPHWLPLLLIPLDDSTGWGTRLLRVWYETLNNRLGSCLILYSPFPLLLLLANLLPIPLLWLCQLVATWKTALVSLSY